MPAKKTPETPGRGGAASRRDATSQIKAIGQTAGAAPDAQIAALQGVVEAAAPLSDTVEFMGARFRIADRIGIMPLLIFAHAAKAGADTEDLDGMAAMYAMIRDCIHPGSPCTCGQGWAGRSQDDDLAAAADHDEACGYAPGEAMCTCGAGLSGGWPDRAASKSAAHGDGCGWDAGDWDAFERHAIDTRAEADDLFAVINVVIEMISARPTMPRSGSTPPPRGLSANSRGRLPSGAEDLVSVDGLARS